MFIRNIQEAARHLARGETSSSALVMQACKNMDHIKDLNVFVSELRESALEAAAAIDAVYANPGNGKSVNPGRLLEGLPIAVKDNFCMKGTRTSCGSSMLDNFVSPYNATVVERTIDEGGIIIGKTNLDEFAMGSGTVDSHYGPTKNIWRSGIPYRLFNKQGEEVDANVDQLDEAGVIAGGSSGGSAVAVAAGCAFASLGSDTGGSVRVPAAWCGVPSIKPSYGLVSRSGLIPLVNSLDVPGLMARTIADLYIYLQALAGPDDNDSTTVRFPNFAYRSQGDNSGLSHDLLTSSEDITSLLPFHPEGVRVGVPAEYFCQGMSEDVIHQVDKVCRLLEDHGAEVLPVSLPHTELAIPCYSVLNPCEVASNMSRYDGLEYGLRGQDESSTESLYADGRSRGFNEVVRGRILAGNYFLLRENYSQYFLQALKIRRLVADDFTNCFLGNPVKGSNNQKGVDFLLTPVTLTDAPLYRDYTMADNRTQTARQDFCTQPVNLAGLPAVTLPVGLSGGGRSLPVSVQLIGPRGTDCSLLAAAGWIESHVDFPHLVINDSDIKR